MKWPGFVEDLDWYAWNNGKHAKQCIKNCDANQSQGWEDECNTVEEFQSILDTPSNTKSMVWWDKVSKSSAYEVVFCRSILKVDSNTTIRIQKTHIRFCESERSDANYITS